MSGEEQPVYFVAPTAPRVGRPGGCKVCSLSPSILEEVNEAIWPNGLDGPRAKDYRVDAQAVVADHEIEIGPKPFTTHADHVEASYRRIGPGDRRRPGERPVFSTDFVSVTDSLAGMGMLAVEQLTREIEAGEVEARELVQVAKLGLGAVAERQKHEDRNKNPQTQILAIFAAASGHLVAPAGEVRNVTPVDSLMERLEDERRMLTARASGEEVDDLAEALA